MSDNVITAIYAALIGFGASALLCPFIIPLLTKLKLGQPIREDSPDGHAAKEGTPTMGGVVIVAALTLGALPLTWGNADALAVLLVTAGFAAIGFADDFVKVRQKAADKAAGRKPRADYGIHGIAKLAAQAAIAAAFIAYVFLSGYDTSIYIPFTDALYVDLGWLTAPFMLCAILGFTNGVNLTDGLDGLAAGVTALVTAFLLFVSVGVGSAVVTTLCGATAGALLGFLLFNAHPARVFMGDTGSLALGGFVSATALLLRIPLVVVIAGGVYLAESLSSILQRYYFKATRKLFGTPRRLFKMAPLHHHFEKSGMPETRVVALFYLITTVLCLIGYLSARHIL